MDNELIKNAKKQNNAKIVLQIFIPLLIAVLSFGYVSNVASSPEFHKETIMSLESKQENVLKLSAITVTTATTASLILGDRASSISDKLLDLTGYFMIILFAIMLEKYLVTIMGLVSFKIIIPIACILFSVFTIIDRKTMRKISLKLIAFAIVGFLIIPLGIELSNTIEKTFDEANIVKVLEESEKIQSEIAKDMPEDDTILSTSVIERVENEQNEQKEGLFATIGNTVGNIFNGAKRTISSAVGKVADVLVGTAKKAVEKLSQLLNRMIETIVVMLITTCLIPLLIIFAFVRLIVILFDADFNMDLNDVPKLSRLKDSLINRKK